MHKVEPQKPPELPKKSWKKKKIKLEVSPSLTSKYTKTTATKRYGMVLTQKEKKTNR